jgi:hypothetical protein
MLQWRSGTFEWNTFSNALRPLKLEIVEDAGLATEWTRRAASRTITSQRRPAHLGSSAAGYCGHQDWTMVVILKPELLEPISGTSLFYPCCGEDLLLPIRLFASAVSNFYFVEIKKPRRPKLNDFAEPRPTSRRLAGTDTFLHRECNREFHLHRWQRRGEGAITELSNLGVFFFRGDHLVEGEGSSGVQWLGGELFPRILALLVSGGIVVTDGSNPGPGGPSHLSDVYCNSEIRGGATAVAVPFDYQGRRFNCVGYVGERYGPTLVWQAV